MFKSFFKFNTIYMITRFCDIFFGGQIKTIIFTAIFVPCFLQLPLIAFGQDGINIVNSRLGIIEVNRKHVESREIAVEITKLPGENRFEFTGAGTEEIFFISSDGKNVVGLLGEPSNKNTSDNGKDEPVEPSFFHRQFVDPFHYEPMDSILYWIMMMFPIIVAIIHPIVFGSRDNIELTCAAKKLSHQNRRASRRQVKRLVRQRVFIQDENIANFFTTNVCGYPKDWLAEF